MFTVFDHRSVVVVTSGVVAVCLAYIYFFVGETSHVKTTSATATTDQQALLAEETHEAVEEEFRQMTDL